ncbi:MAG: DUF2179 domain-containing protein [Candidatus Omnitrophica bacterium]|nr:DUF2179 domain-containing protein [Candidatus Omnitrophota bacterium]
MLSIALNALLIFFLRVTDVSLGTVRMVMVTRGHRLTAAAIGFFEITIWVVAVSKVISHLTNWFYVFGYSGGFAAGTLCGMFLVEKLAIGYVMIKIVSSEKGKEVTEAIRQGGHGATMTQAQGYAGHVSLINVVVSRKYVPDVIEIAKKIDENIFLIVEDVPKVVGGYQRLSK